MGLNMNIPFFHSKTNFLCLALSLFVVTVAEVANAESSFNCPFCSAATQTLRQEAVSMDAVAIATLESDSKEDIDGPAVFKITKVLRGEKLLTVGQEIEASYYGPGKTNKKFLLMGVDPRKLLWSSPLALSAAAEKYMEEIHKLPEDPIARLDFYQQHFEHSDSLLAKDAYDEFALAPYADVIRLKDKMNREQLLKWVQDPAKAPDRKRLYFTMLGICGKPSDADTLESMIKSTEPEKRAGLDALLAAYLTLKGEKGLALIDELFLENKECQYADIYSAVMALRFHGTETDILPKDSVIASMHHLLNRPDLADLVIPDLARWSDWSQIDRVTQLFIQANDDNSWVRVPVVNYLRACPLPEAKEKLKELEKIDPKAVQRASTFFPIPSPAAPKKTDGSSLQPKKFRGQSQLAAATALGNSQTSQKLISAPANRLAIRVTSDSEPIALGSNISDSALVAASASTSEMNLWLAPTVLATGAVTMFLMMWTVATSGGHTKWYAHLRNAFQLS